MPGYISQATPLTRGEKRDIKDALGPNAPSDRLALCTLMRHTLAEILIFFPKLTEHGVTSNPMTNIINCNHR